MNQGNKAVKENQDQIKNRVEAKIKPDIPNRENISQNCT